MSDAGAGFCIATSSEVSAPVPSASRAGTWASSPGIPASSATAR